jgi:hypothetical protein
MHFDSYLHSVPPGSRRTGEVPSHLFFLESGLL